MVEFGEADHVASGSTAVAIEQILGGIHEKAGFVILVKRAQPHPSAAAQLPRRPPIMCLEIFQQGDLLLQLIERLTTHGLLASDGRIRQNAVRQDGEGLSARPTNPASRPDAFVFVVVRLAKSSPVADDRAISAKRAQSRQALQRDYPGSMLSFVSGSGINRITAGVKARR